MNKKDSLDNKLLNRSIFEIVIDVKRTWFGIMNDMISGNFGIAILLKNNRLFYIGITFFVFSLILYTYDIFTDFDEK